MRPSGASVPVPANDRDLAALQQRLEAARRAGRRPPACGPASSAGRCVGADAARRTRPRSSTVRSTSAVCSSSLAGMQPQFRQVPPTPLLLDHGDVQPGRRAVERGGVAAGAATEHDEIEFVGHCGHHPSRAFGCTTRDLHRERDEDHETGERRENEQGPRAHARNGTATSHAIRLPGIARAYLPAVQSRISGHPMDRRVAQRAQRLIERRQELPASRGHVRGRRGHHHRRHHRLRLPDPRGPPARPTREYAALNGLWAIVFVVAPGLLPAARAGGRPGARAPARAGHRRRAAREAGRDPGRRSSPRSVGVVALIFGAADSSTTLFHGEALLLVALLIAIVVVLRRAHHTRHARRATAASGRTA